MNEVTAQPSAPAWQRIARVATRWPLPALLAWALAWAVFAALRRADAPLLLALLAGAALGAACSLAAETRTRQAIVALGFPVSLIAAGPPGAAAALPAWAWLLPLGLLALVYPIRTWRDAPLFPTPAGALHGLAELAPLPPGATVLDAGCGLGAGLRELRIAYPQAALAGLEWSWPLRLLCAWRCRFACVRRGDIWAANWSGHAMVYLFQRPESMARAADKAMRELQPGAWLASLEFEVATLVPTRVLDGADGRRVWLYRLPFVQR